VALKAELVLRLKIVAAFSRKIANLARRGLAHLLLADGCLNRRTVRSVKLKTEN